MKLEQKAAKYLGRSPEADPIQIVKAEGSRLRDAHGKKYIDFTSAYWVENLGWGVAEIERAIRQFTGPTYVVPNLLYAPWVELAELLAKITPANLTKSFRATGGTEAVELALQAAMLHTQRGHFIGLEGSYHGNSIGTFSVASSEYRKKLRGLLPGCAKINPPLDQKALTKVATRLKGRQIAAVVMEPIAINLGVEIPTKEFMAGLQDLAKKYGTLLIMDEVACGFGRTGTLFASEQYPIEPDILCLGKAITGGYGAMGATVMIPSVAKSLEKSGEFYSTYGWHPHSVAAAIATIRYIMRHCDELLAHIRTMSDYFGGRLATIPFRSTPAQRRRGLAIALRFENKKYPEELVDRCRKSGLLISESSDGTLLILPPLTITRQTAEEGLNILEKVVGDL